MLRLSLNHKLVGLLLLGCIGSTTILEFVAVRVSTSILAEHQSVALAAVRSSRQHYLEQYFAIIDGQLRTFCNDPLTAEAVVDLAAAFERVAQETDGAPERIRSSDALREYYETEFLPRHDRTGTPTRSVDDLMPRKVSARILQSMYIARNPHAIGEKDRLDRPEETCDYNRLHGLYQPRTRDFLRTFGYYDIFLFDLDGNLVYSVAKEADFATSFLDGPYADSNLATVYRQARAATTPAQVFMVDYDSYEPSHGAPASFVAAPIFRDGALVGVGAFQLPIDKIDAIVRDPSGLGKSGQVYLVGTNLLMQSNTRFREDAILRQDVATEAAKRALAGETGTMRQVSFSGEPVLASFAPMRIGDLSWGIISEIDAAEIAGAAREVRNRVVVIGLVIAIVISGSLWLLLNRFVLRPVRLLTDAARLLQDGDYTARVDLPRADEIGRLAGTFNHMAESIEHDVEEQQRIAAALAASEERFGLTVRGSGDGLWDHDPATGELWYAERFRELLGYSGEEEYPNVVESWSDGLHPDDRHATLDAFAAHLTRDVPYDVEYRLKTKSGEYRWFRARGTSLRDETGRSYRAAGSITDITEQRESQEELQKLSRAVEQSPATVVITDKDGNIEYANPKFTDVTGYEVEEVLGKNPSILNSGTQPSEFYEDLWRTIASGNEWWGEFCNKKKSGELYWESASISPIRDAHGEVIHYVAVKDDITERKQMNDALNAANERMRRDLEAAARVQQELLPSTLPEIGGLRFTWRYRPCDELGGDLLNVVPINDREVAMYLADVSGHGVAASLVSVSVHRSLSVRRDRSSLIQSHGASPDDLRTAPPDQVTSRLNALYPMSSNGGHFLTVVYATVDAESLEFRYCAAGHPGPTVARPGEGIRVLETHGLPIGVMTGAEYATTSVQLQAGDRLYLYSDGLMEAMNERRELFGRTRIEAVIDATRGVTLDESIDALVDAAVAWQGSEHFTDDLSLLALEVCLTPDERLEDE